VLIDEKKTRTTASGPDLLLFFLLISINFIIDVTWHERNEASGLISCDPIYPSQ
jgi:hypothetical protein